MPVSAKIEKNEIVIRLPLAAAGTKSKTGKSTIVASTNGNQVINLTVDGKEQQVAIGVNAYIKG